MLIRAIRITLISKSLNKNTLNSYFAFKPTIDESKVVDKEDKLNKIMSSKIPLYFTIKPEVKVLLSIMLHTFYFYQQSDPQQAMLLHEYGFYEYQKVKNYID